MGLVECRKCKGTRGFRTKSGKWVDCNACDGRGINSELYATNCNNCRREIVYNRGSAAPDFCKECRSIDRNKDCEQWGCNNTITYKLGWREVPRYCGSCRRHHENRDTAKYCLGSTFLGGTCGKLIWVPSGKNFTQCRECNERERAAKEAQWKTKRCEDCGGEIRYKVDWDKVPNKCKSCIEKDKAKWKEKPCEGKCGTVIKYNTDWQNPPNYCKSCKEKQKQSPRGEKVSWPRDKALPGSDRSLKDLRAFGITGVSVKQNSDGSYHVTLFSSDERYSYDVDQYGNYKGRSGHLTDKAAQLLGKDTIGPDSSGKNRW